MTAIVVTNLLFTGLVACLFYLSGRKNIENDEKFKQLREFVETNATEQAQALTALAKLVDKEFEQQFGSLQKMQEYNESAFGTLAEENGKLYEGMAGTQNFLNKMAEGLGFRTRSNLDDL